MCSYLGHRSCSEIPSSTVLTGGYGRVLVALKLVGSRTCSRVNNPRNSFPEQPRVNTTGQPAVIRFNRIRVKDIVAFEAVHAEALIAQGTYGVSERLYQSVDDKNDLTVQIIGTEQAMQDWLQRPERAALRAERAPPPSFVEPRWSSAQLRGCRARQSAELRPQVARRRVRGLPSGRGVRRAAPTVRLLARPAPPPRRAAAAATRS